MLIRKILSILLSFFLFISIVSLSILYVAKATVLNADFLKGQIAKSSYSENLLSDMKIIFLSYGVVSGFDEQFFNDAITSDMITNDINAEVDRLYSNSPINTSKDLKNKIYDLAIANIKSRNINIFDAKGNIADQDINNSILYFAEICSDTYYKAIKLPGSNNIIVLLKQFQKIIDLVFLALIIFIFIFVILIFIINLKVKDKFCYYMYSCMASIIVLLTPVIYSMYNKFINTIAINNKALYYLVITYFSSAIIVIRNIAYIICFVLLALTIIRFFTKTQKSQL